MLSRPRVAIVASHPVQYHAPWYRALAALVNLHVFFAHRATPDDQARAGFGVRFDWDVPLLEGFEHSWLSNVARRPGVDHFFGCDTPEVAALFDTPRQFDALIVNGWNLLSYWQAVRAARRAGVPVMVRGDSQLGMRGAAVSLAKRAVYPALLRAFDRFLVVGSRSDAYYDYYGVPAARRFRSPHCVDNDFFARGAAAARCASPGPRAAFGLDPEATVFVFAGKLIAKKRPLDLLRALDRLVARGIRAQALVVGDGPLRPELEGHADAHGTPIVMAGFRNQRDIAAAYAAADVLVLPSSAGETWGLVVNEAMACGLPAIVSDAAGCAADLVVDDETGYVFACGDVDGLADRMARTAADRRLRRTLGAQACALVGDFSPAAAARGVIDALASLDAATAGALACIH